MVKTLLGHILPAFLAAVLVCSSAHAVTFHLSEPSDHPDKIDVASSSSGGDTAKAADAAQQGDNADDDDAGADQADGTKQKTGDASKGQTLGDGKYNGVYAAWDPLRRTLPLKSAKLELGMASHKQRQQWQDILSQSAFTGNYSLEGAESDALVSNLNWKVQMHRQLKDKPVTNSLIAMNGGQDTFSFKYQEKEQRTGQAAPATGENRTHNRTASLNYKPSDTLTLSFKSESQLQHAMGDSPTDSTTEKYSWSAGYMFATDTQLLVTHADTTARDRINDKTTRNIKTDATLTMPLAGPFGLRLGYEHMDNNLNTNGAETDHNTRSASLSLIYQLQDNSQLTWTLSHSNLKSLSSTASSDYDVDGQEIDLRYVFSKDLSLSAKNIFKDDDAHGKYMHNQATVSLDHSDFRILPGKTTLTTKKTINRAGDSAQKTTTENHTLNMPLSYFDGRLTAKAQLNLSKNNSLTTTTSNNTHSENHSYNVTYNVQPNIKADLEAKSVENAATAGAGQSSLTTNSVYTEKLSYNKQKPFSSLPLVSGFKYEVKSSRSRNHTFAPTSALTISKVTSHAGTFSLSDDNYTGSYQFEHSDSQQPHAVSFRALKHRFQINVTDFIGFKLTTDYTAIFQTKGFSNNGVISLFRTVDKNNTFTLRWEFSRNQDKNNAAENRNSEYIEAVLELNF